MKARISFLIPLLVMLICAAIPLSAQSPTITGITVANLTATSATINFSTGVAAFAGVSYQPVNGSWSTVNDVTAVNHSVNLPGLTSGTQYNYIVWASGAPGVPMLSFTTTSAATPVITNVQINNITANSAIVSFGTGIAAFSGVSYQPAGGAWSAVNDVVAVNHTISLSGLTAGTQYNYIVWASGAPGVPMLSFRTSSAAKAVISSLQITNITANSAVLGFSTGIAAFAGASCQPTGGNWSTFNDAVSINHTISLNGLTSGTQYNCIPWASGAPASPTVSFTTLVPTPSISSVSVSNLTASTATINFSTGIAAFAGVGYQPVNGTWANTNDAVAASHSISLTGLTPGTQYNYIIWASGAPIQPQLSFSTPTTPVPTPGATRNAGSKMGINIVTLSDWGDTEHMFVDVMKGARGFAPVNTPWCTPVYCPGMTPVPVDANGWPTTDFGVYFITSVTDPLSRPLNQTSPSLSGTYSLSFNGAATVSSTNGSGVIVQNYNYNSRSNLSTAQVVWPQSNQSGMFLTFTGTSGGVQNLKLLRPGYSLGTTQVFTNEFLNAIAPFGAMRFMDALCTNNSTVTRWSQRTQVNAPLQDNPDTGCVSYEHIIQLANLTGKDIWLNIPDQTNLSDTSANNYALNLALLLQSQLTNPNVHVYIEWSNEVWNTVFYQMGRNYCAAINETVAAYPGLLSSNSQVVAAFTPNPSSGVAQCTRNPNATADGTLSFGGTDANTYYWGYRRIAEQTVRMSNIFRSVFGDSSMMTKIRPVLAMQFNYQYLMEDALYYVKKTYPNSAPNNFIYGIAGAPYYQAASGQYSTTDALATALQTALTGGQPSILQDMNHGQNTGAIATDSQYSGITFNGLAQYYNLKSLGYEGGPDVSLTTGSAVTAEQMLSDSRTATMLQQYYTQWFGCGNDLINYWNISGGVGSQWGMYEDITLPTLKSQTLLQIANTPLSSFSTCQ